VKFEKKGVTAAESKIIHDPPKCHLLVFLERGGTCVQVGHRLTTEGLCSVVIGEIGYRARWRTSRAILVIG
jgi:hypothetical protein